jgi:ABC-type phosphate transport system auxiliary subunit
MSDFEEMKSALMRALDDTHHELKKENERLKAELNALQQRYDRVLITLQDSVEHILRVAREGKTEV